MSSHRSRSNPERRRNERGTIAGGEVLALGLLILVGGTLALVNVWAMIDTRSALDAAAREYLRTYTEQRDADTAHPTALAAARRSLELRGSPIQGLTVAPPSAADFGPCAVAAVELSAQVSWATVPFIDGVGSRTIRVVHSELIDPHREVIPGDAYDHSATMCAESD